MNTWDISTGRDPVVEGQGLNAHLRGCTVAQANTCPSTHTLECGCHYLRSFQACKHSLKEHSTQRVCWALCLALMGDIVHPQGDGTTGWRQQTRPAPALLHKHWQHDLCCQRPGPVASRGSAYKMSPLPVPQNSMPSSEKINITAEPPHTSHHWGSLRSLWVSIFPIPNSLASELGYLKAT